MDDLVELLTVTERFQLDNGLVVVPDFSPPNGWKNRSETVTIVLPDRKHRTAIGVPGDCTFLHFGPHKRDPSQK